MGGESHDMSKIEISHLVTRAELNNSLLYLSTGVSEVRTEVRETNKIIREQNAQFATLLGQEGDKREEWCDKHDESHEKLMCSINKKSTKIYWWIIGSLTTILTGSALLVIGYLISRH